MQHCSDILVAHFAPEQQMFSQFTYSRFVALPSLCSALVSQTNVCVWHLILAATAEKERVAFADKDTPEVAQLKLDLLRIAALTGR